MKRTAAKKRALSSGDVFGGKGTLKQSVSGERHALQNPALTFHISPICYISEFVLTSSDGLVTLKQIF
jgi:hypothetical protein